MIFISYNKKMSDKLELSVKPEALNKEVEV